MNRNHEDSARMLFRSLECRAAEEGANRFEISFSSEAPVSRWGCREILLHTKDSVDLSRFAPGGAGSLLFAHGMDPRYGKLPVGRVVRAWLDEAERKCRAVIELDTDDPDAQRLQGKLERGMLSGVSVGCKVNQWLELAAGDTSPDGRIEGPASLGIQWTPYEISLEPVPADATVGLGRAMEMETEREANSMGNITRNESGTIPAQSAPAAQEAPAAEDPVLAERRRATEIETLCRSFGEDPGAYIREGTSVETVRAAILDRLSQERTPIVGRSSAETRGVQVTTDEGDKLRAAATDGLLLRSGVFVEHPADGAREFRGMGIQDVARECLRVSGENAARLSADEVLRRSLTPDSAFVSITSNAANRAVLGAMQHAPTTYQAWTSVGSAKDFKPTNIYEVNDGGTLREIPQSGEFTEAKLSDAPVAVRQLITVGKMLSFTRQMFINDEFDLILRMVTAHVQAFQRGINQAVYALLKANPAMLDGDQLFSSAHKNLGTAAAPGTDSFSEARLLMRRQTEADGVTRLNLSPAFVLCGAADETKVEQLLHSLAAPEGTNSGVANVFRSAMTPVVDAELDVDGGAQPFYFAAHPSLAPTIEVSYLNGVEAPTVETETDFDRLGIRYRVYGDRGVTLLGYRGLVKNPGKA
ncbi:phage major capsid protein [Anaeromassilibacillus sp. An200]|uniref:phage major capsid protein n=1 Tax=Anaeromassilibacillus sp. An200 TaxID=1965587 RepID=UPI000B39EBC8|nr:hypothetical protein [Anaeromassilibacillus sp. An200]OUP12544.1 hypothetical protein B5F35_08360 [Anaeromassilibacillus sp. An200]